MGFIVVFTRVSVMVAVAPLLAVGVIPVTVALVQAKVAVELLEVAV